MSKIEESSGWVQNTSLRYIEERIAIHQSEIERLSEKVYELAQEIK